MSPLFEQCLVIISTFALGICPTESQYQQTYKSSITYRERFQGDGLYAICNEALLKQAKLSTEPESPTRGTSFAMLASRQPWAPGNNLSSDCLEVLKNHNYRINFLIYRCV